MANEDSGSTLGLKIGLNVSPPRTQPSDVPVSIRESRIAKPKLSDEVNEQLAERSEARAPQNIHKWTNAIRDSRIAFLFPTIACATRPPQIFGRGGSQVRRQRSEGAPDALV